MHEQKTSIHNTNLTQLNKIHEIIARNVLMNLPVGSKGFILALEKQAELKLTYRPRGEKSRIQSEGYEA